MCLAQVKQMLKRQGQSSKTINEQIQKKLAENGINKDDLSKNLPVYYFNLTKNKTNVCFFSSYYVQENEHHFHLLLLVNEVDKNTSLFFQ